MTEIRERAVRRASELLRRPPSSGPINRRTELARRSIHHKPHATLITAPPSSAEISRIFADFFQDGAEQFPFELMQLRMCSVVWARCVERRERLQFNIGRRRFQRRAEDRLMDVVNA